MDTPRKWIHLANETSEINLGVRQNPEKHTQVPLSPQNSRTFPPKNTRAPPYGTPGKQNKNANVPHKPPTVLPFALGKPGQKVIFLHAKMQILDQNQNAKYDFLPAFSTAVQNTAAVNHYCELVKNEFLQNSSQNILHFRNCGFCS